MALSLVDYLQNKSYSNPTQAAMAWIFANEPKKIADNKNNPWNWNFTLPEVHTTGKEISTTGTDIDLSAPKPPDVPDIGAGTTIGIIPRMAYDPVRGYAIDLNTTAYLPVPAGFEIGPGNNLQPIKLDVGKLPGLSPTLPGGSFNPPNIPTQLPQMPDVGINAPKIDLSNLGFGGAGLNIGGLNLGGNIPGPGETNIPAGSMIGINDLNLGNIKINPLTSPDKWASYTPPPLPGVLGTVQTGITDLAGKVAPWMPLVDVGSKIIDALNAPGYHVENADDKLAKQKDIQNNIGGVQEAMTLMNNGASWEAVQAAMAKSPGAGYYFPEYAKKADAYIASQRAPVADLSSDKTFETNVKNGWVTWDEIVRKTGGDMKKADAIWRNTPQYNSQPPKARPAQGQ